MTTWRLFEATLFSADGQELHLDEYLIEYDDDLLHFKPQRPDGTLYVFAAHSVSFITKGLFTAGSEAGVTVRLVDGRSLRFPKPGVKLTRFGDFYEIIGDESRALVNVRLFHSLESRSAPAVTA